MIQKNKLFNSISKAAVVLAMVAPAAGAASSNVFSDSGSLI